MPRSHAYTDTQDGYILIAVILALGALSALLSLYTQTVLQSRRLALAMADDDRLDALASGGARLAALELMELRGGRTSPLEVGGSAYVCTPPAGDAVLHILAEDEGGKVDLNTASDALIEALLKGAGASAAEAERLTARIADFRDADDTPRVGGGEAAAYKAAGMRNGPKNAEFESVEELDQVLGMPGWLYARVRPHVTVFNGTSGVDPSRATLELAALLNGQPVSAHSANDIRRTRPSVPITIPIAFASPTRNRHFRVYSTAIAPNGKMLTRDVSVTLPTQPGALPQFERWMRRYDRKADGLAVAAKVKC